MDYSIKLRAFLDQDGKLKQYPAKQKMQQYVLLHLARNLKPGDSFTEMEINSFISLQMAYKDPATIRRSFVDYGFLGRERDGSRYWVLDPQPTAESLGLESNPA